MARLLLFLVCAFAALSSSSAAAFGLETARIVVFSGLVAGLAVLPFLQHRTLPEPEGVFVALGLLLLAIAAQDASVGRLDLVDYKVVLPVMVLGAAPQLASGLARIDLAQFVWRLLSLYVLVTFAYVQVAEPAAVQHGYAGIVRYDPVGSVVMHASLSLIHLLLAITRTVTRKQRSERLVALILGGVALMMVMSTATRTVLVTLGIFAVCFVATARNRQAAGGTVLAACLGLGLAFALYTLAVNDSFLLRLTSAEVEDYGSGRLPSAGFWLGLMGDRPWGFGFGAVRELLGDGKPYLDGVSTLEWPHNEYVRFYVEAGPVGLLFVLLLIAALARRALLAARFCDGEPERRVLLLAVTADLIAESLLQNLLNAIYHATVLVLVLVLAARRAPVPIEKDFRGPIAPGAERSLSG